MSSYQNGFPSANPNQSNDDTSITNMDDWESSTYNVKDNVLSNFNFITTTNKTKNLKYYISIIFIAIILILILMDITSSPSTSAVSTPLSPIDDNINSKKTEICKDDNYFKETLKEEYTQVIGGIIKDAVNADKFEASSVVYDPSRDVYWVVCDSLYAMVKLSSDLSRSDENILVESNVNGINDNEDGIDSGYEGITRDPETDIFYLLTESIEFKDNNGDIVYHPIVRSAVYDEDATYTETQLCAVDFEAASDNKGFEGFNLIKIDDVRYFVGLCEGNYCEAGKKGKESGNGRVVLIDFNPEILVDGAAGDYQYLVDVGIGCLYKSIQQFNLPSYIDFIDYSALQFKAKNASFSNDYDVAIVSQESAAVWVGKVEWSLENGPNFDVNDNKGKTYQFPKGGDCETIFCNVEGVTFINNDQFVMVSDKAKTKGKQPWICGEKDQSIHIFKMP